jgi:mediator of RNA polymerase II transcription subunit 18
MSAGATYEVVLVGQFASSDFEPIFDRCTLRSTTSDSLHLREVVFEPQDEAMSAEMTRKGLVLVTCRADLGKNSGKGKW